MKYLILAGVAMGLAGISLRAEVVAEWQFSEGQGSSVAGAPGPALELTTNGSSLPEWGASTGWNGKPGLTLKKGGRSYLKVQQASSLELSGSYTIEMVFKPEELPSAGETMALITGTKGAGVLYALSLSHNSGDPATPRIRSSFTDAENKLSSIVLRAPIKAGVWHYVATTFNAKSQTMSVYCGGNPGKGDAASLQKDSRAFSTGRGENGGPVAVLIGSLRGTKQFLPAAFGVVRMLNAALTEDQIRSRFSQFPAE